ncbi:MAG: hypothetical protein IKN38_01680 [Clostridia bacterium]|nr:hypothetical protein [Clostridia bacterium]
MTQTANRRRKVEMPSGIRKKFAAALCMLLVATIMMVGSTYAWFTLSTAPEVTGITTNVGANGNLEIALLNYANYTSEAADLGVQTNVGDSMEVKAVTEANNTWGNLVDLSHVSYGLSSIILTPAALNITDAGTTNKTVGNSILMAPTYGSDGRVMTVDEETVTGGAEGNAFTVDDAFAGVRAIGVSSGITLRQSSYRNAISQISSNMQSARNAARASLVDNGANLGGLLMKVASASDPTSVTFTREEVEYLDPMLTSLEEANGYILTGIKNAAIANVLSNANAADLTDDQVTALVAAINAATPATLATAAGGSLPATVDAALTQYNTAAAALTTARGNYTTLTTGANAEKTSYTYSDISSLLNALINKTYVSVAGETDPGRDDIETLANAAMSGDPVAIIMLPGAGIYVDIAKNAGNFTAGPLRVPVTYSGLNFNLTVNMSTQAAEPILLSAAITAANTAGAPGAGAGATSIDDTYGYALDFGFRTNAAGSSLLLQQAPKQRVYNVGTPSENAQTQGAGSYVQFKSTNITTFSLDEMRALMSAMRIVFAVPSTDTATNTTTYEILGVARPDITVTVDGGTGAVTYSGGTAVGADGLKVEIALFDYEVTAHAGEAPTLELTTKKDDLTLTALEQNVAKKITVIVYIDGDIVDNTMVANAATSMDGKLNLQFASSEDLIPMENTALRAGTGSEANPTIPATVSKEQLDAAIRTVKGTEIYTAAAAAAEPTAAQTTLLNRVTAAETVYEDEGATSEQIKTAATNLAIAYVAAGGANPLA